MHDRIAPVFYDRLPSAVQKNKLFEVSDPLLENIYNHNYDTFSFMTELLERGGPLGESLSDMEVNSVEYINKYNGSNCAGLAQKLASDLRANNDIDSIVIPSFGEISPMDTESSYAGVKTTALLVNDDQNRRYILDPALAIEAAIPVLDSETMGSKGVYALSSSESSQLRLMLPSASGLREMHFEQTSLENPDESMQKNWLRSRTKYKICRRYPDGEKDFITYEFAADRFKVNIGAVGIRLCLLSPSEMGGLIDEYDDKIIDVFRNDLIVNGMNRFIANRQAIVEDLLIPQIRKGVTWST
jgi:hypothetical protein